jgi:hypothetical protein
MLMIHKEMLKLWEIVKENSNKKILHSGRWNQGPLDTAAT